MSAIPASLLLATYSKLRGTFHRLFALVATIVLPSVAVLWWQYRFFEQGGNGSGIAFAPFAVFLCQTPAPLLPVYFVLSIAFPLSAYVAYFDDAKKSTYFNLAWLIFAFGAAISYLLAERGPGYCNGNFVWAAQISEFVLLFATAAFFLERLCRARAMNLRSMVPAALFILHVISGVAMQIAWSSHG